MNLLWQVTDGCTDSNFCMEFRELEIQGDKITANVDAVYSLKDDFEKNSDENINVNMKRICIRCRIDIKNKSRSKPKYGLIPQLGPATRPFEIVLIDIIGGFLAKKYSSLSGPFQDSPIFQHQEIKSPNFIKLYKKVCNTK